MCSQLASPFPVVCFPLASSFAAASSQLAGFLSGGVFATGVIFQRCCLPYRIFAYETLSHEAPSRLNHRSSCNHRFCSLFMCPSPDHRAKIHSPGRRCEPCRRVIRETSQRYGRNRRHGALCHRFDGSNKISLNLLNQLTSIDSTQGSSGRVETANVSPVNERPFLLFNTTAQNDADRVYSTCSFVLGSLTCVIGDNTIFYTCAGSTSAAVQVGAPGSIPDGSYQLTRRWRAI